jgi:hypothetical protein
MSPAKVLLGLGFMLVVVFVGTYVGLPGGQTPETPHTVDWVFGTDDGEVLLTHNGGMDVPRDSLFLTIERTESDDERISDLGTRDHRRIVSAFSDDTVTKGETLILAEPEREIQSIYLHWNGSDGTSILASYDLSFSDR